MTHVRRIAALAAACTFILPASAQAAGYADDVLADGPLTYLRLGELAGPVAQDASPHDRDGAYAGDVTLGVAGPFSEAGTAAQLAKTGGIGAQVPAASRSIELWVNPNRLRRGEEAGLVAHGAPAGDGWAVGVGSKRKLAFVAGGERAQSKVSLPSGVWSQLTVTWSAAKVLIYLNGNLAKSVNTPDGLPASSSGAVTLGGTGAGAFTGALAGKVDEVALFADQLTAAQIHDRFLAANVPVNTAPPAISGPAEPGGTLTVTPGTWTNVGAAAPAYQWQRCDAEGDDCGDVDGATGTSVVLTGADACSTFQVAETRTNATGAATAVSAPYGPVTGTCPGTVPAPGPTDSGSGPGVTAPGDTLSPPPGVLPGPGAAGGAPVAGCLKVSARGKGKRKLRRAGRLRVRGACVSASAPLALKFKARRGTRVLRVVRFKLDGKKVKTVRRRGARVASTRLAAGTHQLVVRLVPRSGKPRAFKLRLRVVAA